MRRRIITILLSLLFFETSYFILNNNFDNTMGEKVYAEDIEDEKATENNIDNYDSINEQIKYQEKNEPTALLRDIHIDSDNDIKFNSKKYKYIADVSENSEDIMVKAQPIYKSDLVFINGVQVTKDDKYRTFVNLEKGKNLIKIEVKDSETNVITNYYLYVYRGGMDFVTLDKITMNDSEIGFVPSKKFYNIELDSDEDSVRLEFKYSDLSYSIKVNDKQINETNAIKLKFSSINKYTVNVVVTDRDSNRNMTYILNFYVGIAVTPDPQASINEIIKPNQWVIENGRWQYNDFRGEPLKSTWFFDPMYNKYFHFNKKGYMQTGWLQIDNKEYYLNNHGAMQTGWLNISDEWFYFDKDGAMQTGWIYDKGKWYYLDANGAMKCGWILDRGKWYYLNSDGSMKTGWIIYKNEYYYLSDNGYANVGWLKYNNSWYYFDYKNAKMLNGQWIKYNGSWYYLNYNGTMRTGWLSKDEKIYYLNDDGKMNTQSKIIDEYMCNFNSDGTLKID